MGTQMSSARRGIATDEMKQVAKDEDVTLDTLRICSIFQTRTSPMFS